MIQSLTVSCKGRMSLANTLALVINGVSVALSLVLLVLILWQDSRSVQNLAFGGLIVIVMIWTAGSMLGRATAEIGGLRSLTELGVRMVEIGFTGACLGIYLFTTLATGGQRRAFWVVMIVLTILLIGQLALGVFSLPPSFSVRADGGLVYGFGEFSALLYGSFGAVALFTAFSRREKFRQNSMLIGVSGFCVGILLELISPQLRTLSVSLNITTASLLVIGYSLVREQIIEPLAGRAAQLQAVRDVGLAITSRLSLEDVLSTVAAQAAAMLEADGAAIFLNQGDILELAAVHNLPSQFLGGKLARSEGVAGTVASSRQAIRLESYQRDWSGVPDMLYAKQSFGSVVAAPLIFGDEVMGVLFVVAGVHSKRFDRDDLQLLQLLGPQAAVAITNSRLFERRRALADELEAAKNQLETLLMSTENPVLALNRQLEVLYANYAASDLLSQPDLAGKRITDLTDRNVLPSEPMRALRDLHRWRIHTYEVTIRDKTYMCHLGLLGRPSRAKAQGYVVVLNDITQLKELDRLKNQMIRMTSHDLKNPLSAAMLNTELLLEEGEEVLTPDLRNYIKTIWAQLERMNRITRGILDLERVQSGTPMMEECDMEQIARSVVNEFEDYASLREVTLTMQPATELPPILADRLYLSRALANLVENAIKFTKSGGSVTVSVDQDNGNIVVHVADTGVGISREAQSKVFDRFFRVSPPGMEAVSGTGLGLSLVKSVVDAHRGRIWFESIPGKGTTFHLALPVRPALTIRERP
ncbi:MAG: GAF domain-containing protein [Anaerolineae bacterium]|nr:GAF domain-containing protein [Anaerolineae bacterium]